MIKFFCILILMFFHGCGDDHELERPEYYENDFDWGCDRGADHGYDHGFSNGYEQGYSDAKKGKRKQY